MNHGGSHYSDFSIEPIDVMRSWLSPEAYRGYLRGCVIKYIARYEKKNGVADLLKAKDYLEELIYNMSFEGEGKDGNGKGDCIG